MAFTLAQKSNIRKSIQYNFTANVTNNQLSVYKHPFLTGDEVQLFTQSASLPAPLSVAAIYYVIVVDENHISLATSLDNALAGTAIDITSTGTGYHAILKNIATLQTKIADQCLYFAYQYSIGALTLETINQGLGTKLATDVQMKEWCSRINSNPDSWSQQMFGGLLAQSEIETRGLFTLDADIATAVLKLIKSKVAEI